MGLEGLVFFGTSSWGLHPCSQSKIGSQLLTVEFFPGPKCLGQEGLRGKGAFWR